MCTALRIEHNLDNENDDVNGGFVVSRMGEQRHPIFYEMHMMYILDVADI